MKILYHHRTTASDGSAVHIDGMVDALRARGNDVTVLAPAVATAAAEAPASRLTRLRRKLPRACHEALELAYNAPEAARIARAIRERRPDVIYERSNVYTIAAALLAPRHGILRIVEGSREPLARGLAEDGTPHRETAAHVERRRLGEGLGQHLFAGVEPEQDHTMAKGIAFGDHQASTPSTTSATATGRWLDWPPIQRNRLLCDMRG